MKIEFKTSIKGANIDENEVCVDDGIYTLKIFTENDIMYISVLKRVVNYTDCLAKINGILYFKIVMPEYVYIDIIEYMQYIEVFGALNWGIESICWQEFDLIWHPETEEEAEINGMSCYTVKYDSNVNTKIIKKADLLNITQNKLKSKTLLLPYSYYRHGIKFMSERQYYFAYINFFMLLEYCFGNNQFKTKALLKAFNSADILVEAINTTVISLINNSKYKEYLDWLKGECNEELNAENINKMIINYRGILAHASTRSQQYFFDNDSLRSLIFVISIICYNVCNLLSTIPDMDIQNIPPIPERKNEFSFSCDYNELQPLIKSGYFDRK